MDFTWADGTKSTEIRNLTEDSAHDIIVSSVLNSSAAKLFLALTDNVQQEQFYQTLTEAYLWLLELGLFEHHKARETKNIHDLDWNAIRWELDHGTIFIPHWTANTSFSQDLYDVNGMFLTANILENLIRAELEIEG